MAGNNERSGKPSGTGGSNSGQFVGLGKKSSSTSQLSATGEENILYVFVFTCLHFLALVSFLFFKRLYVKGIVNN